MKRSPIRRKSKKRAKQEREAGPVFDEFLATFSVCWLCRSKPTSEVHHLCSGSFKAKTFGDRRGFFAPCRWCHELLQSGKVSLKVALYWKKVFDPEFWDLKWINRSRGRADDAITEEEVTLG